MKPRIIYALLSDSVKTFSALARNMPITLYMDPISPPSRSVVMTAEAIGLNVELKTISLNKLDHLKPEFLKINPQHTVPTLVDESTVLWDSHAIVTYLASKYGRNDSLYPRDLKKRALVEQRLHFDTGSLFIYLRLFIKKCLSKRGRTVEEYEKAFILESYSLMEEFLNQTLYMAGDVLTIADLSIVSSVTGLNMIVPIDKHTYPKLSKWLDNMEMLPYYNKVNSEGLVGFKGFIAAISDAVKL